MVISYKTLPLNGTRMFREKVICPDCQREGKKSRRFIYSVPDPKFKTGYWDENGDFVEPKLEFEPPWFICTNNPPHITQTFKK
ncbi:MAG: hypothetical protein ACRD8Z_02240 [Nitrososphaeraceae archaeon]